MDAWIDLATQKESKPHVSFLFYWIAYEAAYQINQFDSANELTSKGRIRKKFYSRLIRHDNTRKLSCILHDRREDIERLLALRWASPSFWRRDKKSPDNAEDWEQSFDREVQEAKDTLDRAIKGKRDGRIDPAVAVLDKLFACLSVVRNQIVHGGSAASDSWGKTQVTLGATLVDDLVPFFRPLQDFVWAASASG